MSAAPANPGRVLVLGAYGLIGAQVCQHLQAVGYSVIAAGRNQAAAARRLPVLPFVHLDMARLTTPTDWAPYLADVSAVVNCAGALQDDGQTNLEALHHNALAALGQAAAPLGIRVVQISAIGAEQDSPIAFLSSKARGDAALLASGAKAVVLRPGLVIAQGAYGGTQLIRLLAAVPLFQPLALPKARLQSVSALDVAKAVSMALAPTHPTGKTIDLVEKSPKPLADIIAAHRHALGFAPASFTVTAPNWVIGLTGHITDALGHLGWRSPLRSTATRVLHQDLVGDPSGHPPLPDLPNILRDLDLGPEHRLQARMALLMPFCVAILALFWTISGIIGVVSLGPAAAHLEQQGWPDLLAKGSVLFWSLIDVMLGLAILWRPWARRACLGMAAVCLIYLALSSLFTPIMWLDPLGPLVKIGPALMLALVTWALLEER